MLCIQQVRHLAHLLGVSVEHLEEVAESAEGYCEELVLLDPAKPEKPRDVVDVRGPLRKMQLRLHRGVLLPKLPISAHSHGGVRGRHIKSNVTPHLDSTFVFGTDISKIRVKRGHLDVRGGYVKELERQLADAASLANGGDFDGPYYTEGQIRGRVQFVCWVNPGRKRELMRHFRAIPWGKVGREAARCGLVATKKVLMKRM